MSSLLSRIRYRFLLVAGLMPYFMGAAAAYRDLGGIDPSIFLIGLAGIAGALVGVEGYNEFFEGRSGADLVFMPENSRPPSWTVIAGTFGFAVMVSTGLYLSLTVGPLILFLMIYGLLAAVFYVGPPLKWAYRGVGEFVISLAYGPFMTIGAYYIQAASLTEAPIIASLVPAFLTFAVVLSNEVPQFIGDRLVGKMNLVVKFGQERAAKMHATAIIAGYCSLLLAVWINAIPLTSLIALLTIPIAVWTLRISLRSYDKPTEFIKSIRGTVIIYTLVLIIVSISYLIN